MYAEGTPDLKTYTTGDGRQGAGMTLRVFTVQLLGGRGDTQMAETGGSSTYQTQAPANSNQGGSQAPYSPPASQSGNTAQEITEPMDDLPF